MFNFLSVSSVFSYIGYILLAIIVLLLMVLIHEFGHYTAGKILKFKINEFSVGFGPKIVQKKKKNGELFTLRLIPLGGYCAFDGENEDGTENPQAFNNQKPWKRLIVLFCGAFFNFLSAIIFSVIALMACGYEQLQVKQIAPTSINARYLQSNDIIYGIEGNKIDFVTDDMLDVLITNYVENNFKTYKGEDLTSESSFVDDGKTYYMVENDMDFMLKRDNKKITQTGKINVIYDSTGKLTGWSLYSTNDADASELQIGYYKYNFGEALLNAIPFTCRWAWKVLVIFGQLITGQLSIKALGGPVTTIKSMATMTMQSFNILFLLLPLIAVNLAVFNLLPIPALDGFQMIFVIIEWIRKKPVKREVVNMINNIGLIVLFGFVILVDILQFVL